MLRHILVATLFVAAMLAAGATSRSAQPSLPSTFHATTIHSPEGAEIFVRSGGSGPIVVLLHGYAVIPGRRWQRT